MIVSAVEACRSDQSAAVEACRSDQSAALIWELFAGCAPTTPAAVRGGHNAGEPIDLLHGFGLQDLMTVEAAIWAIKAYPPALVTLAFPRSPWSDMQVSSEHQPLLRFTVQVALVQKELGELTVIESPLGLAAWQQPPLKRRMDDALPGGRRGSAPARAAWMARWHVAQEAYAFPGHARLGSPGLP